MILLDTVTLDTEQANVFIQHLKDMIPSLIDFGFTIVIALIIWFVGTRIIKFVRKIGKRAMDRSNLDEGVKQFLDSFMKFAMYFLLVVIIGTKFGVTTASVIALLGSAGLAVGLAMQGSLSNFAGGVLILLLKPFLVGDYILTESGLEGTVKEIQIFYTRLLTVDGRVVVIPNGKLSDGIVTNVSKMDKRRVDLTVDVTYQANLGEVKKIIKDAFEAEQRRILDEPIDVYVDKLGQSAVSIGVKVWVHTEDYLMMKNYFTEQLKLVLDQHQIEIPYPKMDVMIKQ